MSKRLIALTLLIVLVALAFLPGLARAQPAADPVFTWGNGADGDLTISAGSTFNINTGKHPGRVCANGGDGVAYEVIGLTANTATLSGSPSGGCLNVGDEFILINMRGSSGNTGNNEMLRVKNVSANLVTFTTNKKKFYGAHAGDDSGLGGTQHVVLQRVPNYNNLTLNGSLISYPWNGVRFGLVVFRVKGNWTGSGNINLDSLGYRGGTTATGSGSYPGAYQGESWPGTGITSGGPNAGGGGGRNVGQTGNCSGGQGNFGGGVVDPGICFSNNGDVYGVPKLDQLYLGSGGGGRNDGGTGGNGGGTVYVMVNNANFLGTITAKGANGQNSGGGSGGSIRIEGGKLTLGVLNARGGDGVSNGTAGVGRIAIYYVNSRSWSAASPTPYVQQISSTPTPSPTRTFTKTSTPTRTQNLAASATALALTLTAQVGPTLTPDLNATGTALSLTMTARVVTLSPSPTPNHDATGTALSLTMTAQAATPTPTPDHNATGTSQALTATAQAGPTLTPDLNATGTALSLTMTSQAASPTPSLTPDHNATGTSQALTATAQAGGTPTETPDFNATGTALAKTATAWASSPTPSITPTPTLTPTLSPTASPSSTPNGGNGGTATPSGGGGGEGSGTTPTATTQPFGPSSGAPCDITLNVYVYVDSNNDSMMAAQGEGVNSIQVNFLDTSFGKLGQSYTYNGKSTFCVPDYLKGQTLRVDIPYLQRTGITQAPDNNNKGQPLEVWFRLTPPTLPLYIP